MNELKRLAKNKGLDVLENSIVVNESGVDFQVAYAKDTLGRKWILRIPRRLDSMRSALKEKGALEIMEEHVSFQVPNWSIFDDELIAYKQLDGVPVATIDVEQQDYVWSFDKENTPQSYYQSLGKVLAELHTLPHGHFKEIGIKTLHAKDLNSSMKIRMEKVRQKYHVNSELWERWQEWLANDSLWPSHVGVSHGDLHPGHILINKNFEVSGLIDWTEISIADTSVDFLSHLLLFGKDGLTKVLDAYDNAGGRTWSRMDEHIIELLTTSAITVAEFAEISDLQDMRETAAHMLTQNV